jgi:hypothetical protein
LKHFFQPSFTESEKLIVITPCPRIQMLWTKERKKSSLVDNGPAHCKRGFVAMKVTGPRELGLGDFSLCPLEPLD